MSQGLNGLCKHLLMVPPNHHIPIKKITQSKLTSKGVWRDAVHLWAFPPHPQPLHPILVFWLLATLSHWTWPRGEVAAQHTFTLLPTDRPTSSVCDEWCLAAAAAAKKIMNGTKSASREGNCPQTKSYIIEGGRMVRSVLWGVLEVVSFSRFSRLMWDFW